MPTPSFDSLVDLQLFLSTCSKEQFQEKLALFSLAELAACVTLLQMQFVPEAESKLHHLLEFIDSHISWELISQHFSISSFISFLEFIAQHPQYQNRLTFILIGLDPLIFSQSLSLLQNNHLAILRQEGLLEPLQYQLMQFTHEGEILRQEIEQNVQQFQEDLSSIKPEELTQKTLKTLRNRIENFRDQFLNYLERASTALAIAWHTDRVDLIEKLSSINESIQHQLALFIGHPNFNKLAATGLYAFLENFFSNIFDSSLKNDDAAIEGLTRLSIWHLKDYWELGLLPSIQRPEELDLDPQKHSEKERLDYQQKFIALVQMQLSRLRIEKVKDLKKFHLFSKSLFKTYIEQHQHLLLKEH